MATTEHLLDRRAALALAGSAAGALASGPASAAVRPLDLSKSEDLLEAMVKVRSDTSGAQAMTWSMGHIWSRIDGRPSQRLLRTEAITHHPCAQA